MARERLPIDEYLTHQELRVRHERRLMRGFLLRVESLDALRQELLNELTDPKGRLDSDDLCDLFYLLGAAGNGYLLDELIRIGNPNVVDDPLHIDLDRQPLLRHPNVRAQFIYALGLIGEVLPDSDSDRLAALMRLLRRGLIDDALEVKVAALDAIRRSVKLNKSVFECFYTAIPKVVQLLANPDWAVRRNAIDALAHLPAPESLKALQELSERESDAHLQWFAERAIRQLRDRMSHFRFVVTTVQEIHQRIFGRK